MMGKMMMTAAFAMATLGAPATAQTTGSGSMGDTGAMGTGGMEPGRPGGTGPQSGTMAADGAMDMRTHEAPPPLTRSQMASMRRCQAMTPARMARNAACAKMQRAHPDMMAPATMAPQTM